MFQHLETFDPDLRLKIIEAAVNELPPDYSIELKKALARDGFTVEGDAIIPDEPIAQELGTALCPLSSGIQNQCVSTLFTVIDKRLRSEFNLYLV